MPELFRKSSIKNYSNSEQLDRAVRVASPMSWIGIIAVGVLIISVVLWSFFGSIPEVKSVKAVISDKMNSFAVHTPVSGSLMSYAVGEGDVVKKGQIVATVKHSGEKIAIKSPVDGNAGKLLLSKDTVVYAFDELLRVTPKTSGEIVAMSYLPVTQSNSIKAGMEAKFYIKDEDVCLDGEVLAVSDYAASNKNMKYVIGRNNSVRKSLTDKQAVASVIYKIKNKQINGSYVLSDNEMISIKKGSIVRAKIITEYRAPVSLLFGFLTSGEAKGE